MEMNKKTVNLLEPANSRKIMFSEQACSQRIDTSKKVINSYIKIYQCSEKCSTCYKKFCFGKEVSVCVSQKI